MRKVHARNWPTIRTYSLFPTESPICTPCAYTILSNPTSHVGAFMRGSMYREVSYNLRTRNPTHLVAYTPTVYYLCFHYIEFHQIWSDSYASSPFIASFHSLCSHEASRAWGTAWGGQLCGATVAKLPSNCGMHCGDIIARPNERGRALLRAKADQSRESTASEACSRRRC